MNGNNIPIRQMMQLLDWIQNHSVIVAIIIATVAVATYFGISASHYEVSISPFSGEINPGEEINSTIIIEKFWMIFPINFDKRTVELTSDLTQLDGISVKYYPINGTPDPHFSSKMVISVLPGTTHRTLKIPISISDGKQTIEKIYFLRIGRGEYGGEESSALPTQSGTNPTDVIAMIDYYYPSGWMGDVNSIEYHPVSTNIIPHTGSWNLEINYSPEPTDTNGWSGICWQYPDNNWGNMSGGYDLSKYSRLTFWARGKNGGEQAEFKVGGLSSGSYPDSLQPAATTQPITLSNEWTKYSIDLTGKDLHRIGGGFIWVSSRASNPEGCTIYLNDIQFER